MMLWHHLDGAPPPCVGAAPGRTAASQAGMDAGCCCCCCCCAKLLLWGRMHTERESGKERERERVRGVQGTPTQFFFPRDCLMLPSDGGCDGVAPTHARHAMFRYSRNFGTPECWSALMRPGTFKAGSWSWLVFFCSHIAEKCHSGLTDLQGSCKLHCSHWQRSSKHSRMLYYLLLLLFSARPHRRGP